MNNGGSSLKIRWHGHACFEIGNSTTIVTDPHDGKSIGIRPPHTRADIILISHDHFDHNCARSVEGRETTIIKRAARMTKNGVVISGMRAYHDDARGEKRGENVVFRFEVGETTFCHLGDLGHFMDDGMLEKLGDIDVLFIPVGNVFTIGPEEAWKVIESINPKIAVPMHYRVGGLSLSIKPVDPFLNGADGDTIVRVGNEIEFEREDLPEELEVWVFTL